MKKIAAGVIILLVIVGASFLFIYSGVYNISAMDKHNAFTLWMINTLKDNSIAHHAKEIKAPDLDDLSLMRTGFIHYREMCVGCHGAPGISRDEIGRGLYPTPPDLARSSKELSQSELFWITKNGIKMTGMPAFGRTHSDDKIWAIVAFLERLPDMTKEQYEMLDKTTKSESDD